MDDTSTQIAIAKLHATAAATAAAQPLDVLGVTPIHLLDRRLVTRVVGASRELHDENGEGHERAQQHRPPPKRGKLLQPGDRSRSQVG